MAEITRQYMVYVDLMKAVRFELAAEYLVMAAMLGEIKSRLLLPRPKTEEGEEVDPRSINWASERAVNYTLRQDSGAGNSLGSIRISMPNPHSVYMHDTPLKSLFGRSVRYESSGCVRVNGIETLVDWILQDSGGWNMQRIMAVKQSAEQIDVKLVKPIPVYFTYVSAWATPDGMVQFRPDIYNQDGASETASVN